jgi:hypothetical protein
VQELGTIPAGRDDHTNRVGGAFTRFVKVDETLAQSMNSDTDDGVALGVEIRLATKSIYRNGILFDPVCATGGGLFTDIAQDLYQICRAPKSSGLE